MNKVNIFGIDFSNVSRLDFAKFAKEKITKREKILIYDVNTYVLYLLRHSIYVKNMIKIADLVFADGASIILAGKVLGKANVVRYPGVDRMVDLLNLANEENFSVFLLGGTDDVLFRCVNNIKKKYKNINICGYNNGFFNDGEDSLVVEVINKSNPDILFIGMPVEKTAVFLTKNLSLIKSTVIMPVGGSFEIISGDKKRAPEYIQKIGMEWLYRTLQDPKGKFIRYLISHSYFLYLLTKHLMIGSTKHRNYE